MTNSLPDPEILPLGIDGVLVRFARTLSDDANARALAFRDHVQSAGITGVLEVASSLVSVRVAFDAEITNRSQISLALKTLIADDATTQNTPKRLWRIPAAFGPTYAPQLAQAASLAGRTAQQAIADIEATRVRVIAIGFAPGQPYLGMLPDHWDIPRQNDLTENLPQGALITAVRQLIIWAAEAPTGWRHIGQTAFRVYRPETQQPFAFEPGDVVQFRAVSDTEFENIRHDTHTNGGAICEDLR